MTEHDNGWRERDASLSSNPLCAELRSIAQNEYMIDQHYLAHGHTMNEAADEIERLDARVSELESAPGERVFRGVMKDNAEIAADNDRLRARVEEMETELRSAIHNHGTHSAWANLIGQRNSLREELSKYTSGHPLCAAIEQPDETKCSHDRQRLIDLGHRHCPRCREAL